MKKITLASIIQRLINRFKLHEATYEMFGLSETVIPTTDIDELLKVPKNGTINANLGGGGAVTLFTVPVGKRWNIRILTKFDVTVGTVNTYLIVGGVVTYVISGATGTSFNLNLNWILEAGDTIVASGGNVADTNINYSIHYIEENAF